MAPPGDQTLTIHLQNDGDVVVCVHGDSFGGSSERSTATMEFCSPGAGGGRSSRTRQALIALMVAIEEDNAASPMLAWPPQQRHPKAA